MIDQDSAYIIHICTGEEECFQVFATNKFEMMAVLKKTLTTDYLVSNVEAIGNVMTAKDYLNTSIDNDLNFGYDKGDE
jgi:hypothetical protein